jgi:hypothetical protein
MTDIKLTDSQRQIIEYAVLNTNGKLEWFPDNIKGGARNKVIDAMFNRALITRNGDGWCIAAEGYDAIGVPRPGRDVIQATEPEQRRTRANSKQAEVIAMLKRPEGATIGEICTATGWQQHTVRGTFAGAFKKKLGLEISSVKEPGRDRVYRIDAQ